MFQEDLFKAIDNVNTIQQWQSVALWLLKFCLRGFYYADIVQMSQTQIEDIDEHKMGHLLSTYLKDEVYINFMRSKTDFPMYIHIHNYPTLSLLTRLKMTFIYTHSDRKINGNSVLADINDKIKIFDYDVKANFDKHKNLHKKTNERSSELGLIQKRARKTFNQYADRLEMAEEIRKILLGQASDKMLGESYNDNTLKSKLDRVEKAHLDVLKKFKADEIFDRLLVRLKGLIIKDNLPKWLLISGGVTIKGESVKVLIGNPQNKIEWANIEGKYKKYFRKYEYKLNDDDLFEDKTNVRVMNAIADIYKQEQEIKDAETKVFKLPKQA